jgi:hypothetical protein
MALELNIVRDEKIRSLKAWLLMAILVASSLSPLTMFVGSASAAQITSRSVAITTSKAGATATYTYTYTLATAGNVGSISFQACTTPLGTCTSPGGTISLNAGSTTIVSGWAAGVFTRSAAAATTNCTAAVNMLCTARSSAVSETAASKVMTASSQVNPAVGSYFIRITTYSDIAWVTPVDAGTVGYAVANQLTVNARVQEVLNFCVGTTTVNDATTTPGTDCTAISGSTVDIGVLDSGSVALSPVSTNGGNSFNGVAMLRTNAQSGATVSYYAEQDTSSGALKVVGAACGSTLGGGSTTDQCINTPSSTNGNQATLTAGTEAFGMTIAGVNCGSTASGYCTFTSGTNNLKQTAGYIGGTTTSYGTGTGFAWRADGTAVQIASSTTVVDDEALILRFSATPAITTPTGAYTTTSTYIATATY